MVARLSARRGDQQRGRAERPALSAVLRIYGNLASYGDTYALISMKRGIDKGSKRPYCRDSRCRSQRIDASGIVTKLTVIALPDALVG